MKTPKNISQNEKKRLAIDLENEKNKIIAGKKNTTPQSKVSEEGKKKLTKAREEEDSRKLQLHRAFQSEPYLIRFIYKIKGMLSRVAPEELYQESLLQDLRINIARATRGNILVGSNKISGKFIARLYRAYVAASAFSDVLSTVFKRQKIIELYTRYAFKNLFKEIEIKRELSEIVNLEELRNKIETIEDQTEGKTDDLNNYLGERRTDIRRYVKDLSPEFINRISRNLNELYHLYLFSIFDYKKFFITMGATVNSFKNGSFDDVPVSIRMKKHFESFYQYVPILTSLWVNSENNPVKHLFACATIVNTKDPDETFQNIEEVVNKDKVHYVKQLQDFSKSWTSDICQFPFLDLIRLVSLNSFYEPKVHDLPNLNLNGRIKKFVEQQLLFELELFTNDIREGFNVETKKTLLQDYENSMLEYYSQDSIMNTGRFYGIPGFAYVNSVNMLHNFLTKYYAKNIKRIFAHLVRSVLPKNSNLRTMILNQSIVIDNLEERIRNLNRELNPENAWGKNLMNIIYRLEKNDTGNLLKQIKDQLKEVDTEAEDLLNQGLKVLQSGSEQLQALIRSENSKLREAMNASFLDTQVSLLVATEKAIHAFSDISNLIRSYYR